MITAEEIRAKYWALEVLSSHNQEDINNISGSLGTSKIDLNPHQINAASYCFVGSGIVNTQPLSINSLAILGSILERAMFRAVSA